MNWKFWQRRKPLIVLLATRNERAIQAAAQKIGESTRREAFTTGSALRLIKGCNLIVLDASDLAETDDVVPEALDATARGSGATVVTGAAFAADPIRYESEARLSVGDLRTFPMRSIANINYAGGVGKTTLALDLAAYFARRTNLPAAVIELSQGASALHALIDPELPHFFDMLTQGVEPVTWRGVTLVPMVFSSARMVMESDRRKAVEFIAAIQRRHMLTVFDVVATHPLWPEIRPLVQQIYVVVSPKPDSVLQGDAVLDDLREMSAPPTPVNGGEGPDDVRFVANLVSGARDRVALSNLDAAVSLPRINHPMRFEGRLGRRLMPVVYPGWGKGN